MKGIDLSNVDAYKSNKHSNFDLSFKRKFDGKFGDLIPFMCLPVIPDDTISINVESLMRFAPFVQQVFQDYKQCVAFYYVPNRVLWHNFSKFMTGGWDGKQTYVHPYIDAKDIPYAETSGPFGFMDYMDVPPAFWTGSNADITLNALPFAAYLRCVLDYHLPHANTPLSQLREQYNQEQILSDGNNTQTICNLLLKLMTNNINANMSLLPDNAAYGFQLPQCLYPLDYFTMSRPDTQNGPIMTIPLKLISTDADGTSTFRLLADASTTDTGSTIRASTVQGSNQITIYPNITGAPPITVNGSVFNNVATINEFESAARIQELLSLYGFSGLTSDDKIAAEFGVRNPNSSLQQSRQLSWDMMDVAIGEVFSSDVNVVSPDFPYPNDIAGAGTAIAKLKDYANGFKDFYFQEHGFLIGITWVYPEASYQEGLPRMFALNDRFDYAHPLFSELGMQSIKKREIDCKWGQLNDQDFSYNPRYAEHKVGINRVNGSLRDNLSSMTAGRIFQPDEGLYSLAFNDRFLKVDPTQDHLNRTFNVLSNLPTDKPLFFDLKVNIQANRALPYYGLPKF